MNPILSVQNKDFMWDGEKKTKILGAVAQAKSHLHWHRIGIWKIKWRSSMESPHFNTSLIRDKWHCWKSRSTSETRHFGSIATIGIGRKMVVWFYGMLLPSSKCPRPPGRVENHSWKAIRRTIWRPGIVCVPDDCCKNHGRYCEITRLWRTSSWCSIWLHSSKIGGRSEIAQNSKVRMSSFLGTSSTAEDGRNHGKALKIRWYLLKETCMVIRWLDCCGKTVRRSFIRTWMGKSTKLGIVCSFIENKVYFCQNTWMAFFSKTAKKQNMAPMWKKLMKNVAMCAWDALRGNANQMKRLPAIQRNVWITYFCWSNWKTTGKGKASRKNSGPSTWKDMLKNALNGTVNWQTRKWSNCTKFPVLVWMITISRTNSNQLEDCQKCARRL